METRRAGECSFQPLTLVFWCQFEKSTEIRLRKHELHNAFIYVDSRRDDHTNYNCGNATTAVIITQISMDFFFKELCDCRALLCASHPPPFKRQPLCSQLN